MAMSIAESGLASHPIFTTDPAEQMTYVYKELCVCTEDGQTHTGRCFTVDPVSQSIALVKFDENAEVDKLQIIMGHCIQKITILDVDSEKYKSKLDNLFRGSGGINGGELTEDELKQRKEALRLWLLKNRIPVETCQGSEDVLSISDALFIDPPYSSENCRSTNEIILGRVQGLIKSMPADQSKW